MLSAWPAHANELGQAVSPTKTPAPSLTPIIAETPNLTPPPALTLLPSPTPTILPAWLLGRIYNDLNSNSAYDDGEGIANVNLSVTDSSGFTRLIATDLRGGFTLSMPAGQTLIVVNESTLPSGVSLISGLNPSLITLLSGSTFSFGLGYRAPAELTIRLTPTPSSSPTPAPTPTSITPVEVDLTSRANITPANGADLSVKIGDQIDYTVTVKATTGSTSEITITVPVPDGTEYIAGSAIPNDERADARVPQSLRHALSWRVRPLASGQKFVARFSVRVVVGTGIIVARANASNAVQNVNSNEVVNKSRPTAVSLAQFETVPSSNGIKITWQTSVELDTFGFAVYRGREGDTRSSAVLLNASALIPARGGTAANYEFVDETTQPGQRYVYWLHEIERSGLINEYGPLQASMETQTSANAVVPSNVMAGGVPVPVPIGSGSQNIPVPATPAIASNNSNAVQILVTQVVVQQQVVVPTLAVPLPNPQPEPLPVTQPTPLPAAPIPAESIVVATPEPMAAPAEQAATLVPNQTSADATATVAPPAAVASIATIALPSATQVTQPTSQSRPISAEARRTANAIPNNTNNANHQPDLLAWIIWALIFFVVWFVVAGILGIALGQYLRQR
jgi:hypothetical protein